MLQIALWKRVIIWLLCIGGLLIALPNAFYSRVETFNDAKLLNETSDKWPFFALFFGKFRFRFRGGAHL